MDVQFIESLLSRSDHSTYRLVRLASLRALELADGKPSLVRIPNFDKLASVALKEIQEGKVYYKGVEKEIKAELKVKREESESQAD